MRSICVVITAHIFQRLTAAFPFVLQALYTSADYVYHEPTIPFPCWTLDRANGMDLSISRSNTEHPLTVLVLNLGRRNTSKASHMPTEWSPKSRFHHLIPLCWEIKTKQNCLHEFGGSKLRTASTSYLKLIRNHQQGITFGTNV